MHPKNVFWKTIILYKLDISYNQSRPTMNPAVEPTDKDINSKDTINATSPPPNPSAMKPTISVAEMIKKYSFWIRINLAIEIFLKKALLSFLHNESKDPTYTGLTTDPEKLYTEMKTLKSEKVFVLFIHRSTDTDLVQFLQIEVHCNEV